MFSYGFLVVQSRSSVLVPRDRVFLGLFCSLVAFSFVFHFDCVRVCACVWRAFAFWEKGYLNMLLVSQLYSDQLNTLINLPAQLTFFGERNPLYCPDLTSLLCPLVTNKTDPRVA